MSSGQPDTNKKIVILFLPLIESGEIFSNIPWVLLALERMIRQLDIEIMLLDERTDPDYTDMIRKTEGRLLFAGVSAVIGYQIAGGVRFSEAVKSVTSAPVIWGGWFPTVLPEIILKEDYVDYVCVGQGEIPFRSFTEKMISGQDVSDIPGIGYKKNGKIIINPCEKFVDPGSFPPADLQLVEVNRLIDINGNVPAGFRGVDYLASTGCPNSCGFCSVVHVYEHKWFPKKIPEIINDLRYLKENAGISHVTFWDENIFASRKFVLAFCEELIRSGLSLTWGGYAHIGYFLKRFSDDDIRLIYKSGCREIRIGAESGDQEVLDLINKKIQVNDTLKIVRLLKKHHIRTRVFAITCFPENPDRDFRRTLNLIGKALLIDRRLNVKIRFFVPLPKTDLYQVSIDHGFVPPSSVKELTDFFTHRFTMNFTAPWCKKDYHTLLNDYEHFYFLFADPLFFKRFPLKWRPFAFLLNGFLYPVIFVRFKCNWMKFPAEARLFKKFMRFKTPAPRTSMESTASLEL